MSSRFDAEVIVMPKKEVADPQGQAIEGALSRLQLTENGVQFEGIHVGRVFRFAVDAATRDAAEKAVETLADRVLANPNVEAFRFTLQEQL
ncbi:phosphoribosylformylglycinamidine synthase subunit PurS [bacterium]|nr:phosphoribosylformylglycinamidine synthase subunit PurS [bacterium]